MGDNFLGLFLLFSDHCREQDPGRVLTFKGSLETSAKPSKTTPSVIHLHNAKAHQYLDVSLGGQKIKRDPNSVYIGIRDPLPSWDRSLAFRAVVKVVL